MYGTIYQGSRYVSFGAPCLLTPRPIFKYFPRHFIPKYLCPSTNLNDWFFTPRDPQIFQKYKSHLGLVGARWMIWSESHTDDMVLEWHGNLTDIWRYFSCMLTDTHCYMQGGRLLSIYAENVRRRLRKCIRLVFVHSCSQPYKWDEVIV